MKGKLVIIEGGDGAGKKTQATRLVQRLQKEQHMVRKIEFPNYNSSSSALAKMYLNGEFGNDPNDVNAFAASTFFAVDRFASFRLEWEQFYNSGGIVVCDRYTTSNVVHQASKIEEKIPRQQFIDWLFDLEYEKLQLPMPDSVIYLDVPPEYSLSVLTNRRSKMTGKRESDIHEADLEYLFNTYQISRQLAQDLGWTIVNCIRNGFRRNVIDVHEEIYREIKGMF